MNQPINSPKLTKATDYSQVENFKLASYISLQRLNRSRYQLEQIATDHPNKLVCKEAVDFLKKNNKLIAIANDLINRLKDFSKRNNLKVVNSISDESLLRLKTEIDILDDMHFNIAKSYSTFIYKNYEATVITLDTESEK